MSYKTLNFSTTALMDMTLNGLVIGGKAPAPSGGKVLGLNGLTLIIGIETTTFSDVTEGGLTLPQIKTAIESATTGITVSWESGRLVLSHATAISVKKTGTANSFFGFPTNVDVDAAPINPPDGGAPRIISIGSSPRMDSYFVVVEV